MSSNTTELTLGSTEALSKLKLGIFLQGKDTYYINYLHLWLDGSSEPVTYDKGEMQRMGQLSMEQIASIFDLSKLGHDAKIVKYELELINTEDDNE